jgi:dephospho-CoA kinase
VERVLLTGMSGTGKSSVIRELGALGYKAVDTDDGWCEQLPGGRQRWREDAIARLLDTEDADVLFIAGCEENQVRFHPRFDLIILLSAPAPAMIERLSARTGNPYGKVPGDMDRILGDLAAVSRYCGRQPITRSGRSSRWPKWSRRCCTWPASPRTAMTRQRRAPADYPP